MTVSFAVAPGGPRRPGEEALGGEPARGVGLASAPDPAMNAAEQPTDVVAVHAMYGDFVWSSLQRLGARDADLEDLFQEVFVVVHRRLSGFEGRARVTTWLFGICLRVVSAYRRKMRLRRELPSDDAPEQADPADRMPDATLTRKQAAARLAAILDEMDLEKRAVFVMAVIEEMPSDEIAVILDIPVGTVYSRLHTARKQFGEHLARWNQRDERGGAQ